MTQPAISMTYEAHSAEPEYIETNRALIASLDLEGVGRLLDLACGTGLLSELILERRPGVAILGLDLAREQLELMRERFAGRAGDGGQEHPAMLLMEGSADTLPVEAGAVDAVVMGNAIHNLPDPDALVREIVRVLRPGGSFTFNSAFYAGTYVPGTEKFHQAWAKEAVKFVLERDRELRAQGLPGITRKRGTGSKAFARRWLLPGEWKAILERNGLRVTLVHERDVEMTRRSYETVGSYAGFSTVVLAGYPPELACEAMQAAVAPALAATGFETVPARWLEMTAVRPAAAREGRP
jgi:SAM-dependent methyltransferase